MNVQILGRRLVYIAAMVLLLFPIYLLGHPAVIGTGKSETTPGGALATIRSKYELGQADLGEIDPASESMRLATLGLRGVAVSILWQRAEYYKREQFWDNYSATLNQITRLEPHFVKVWDFLSWNLAYNISVEFDDYRQRYAWVKKGIDYLLTGTKYNRRKTDLPYGLGWNFGNKFGVSDEKVQFRQLYRLDSDWHEALADREMDVTQPDGLGPDGYPDSWLTGKMWYDRCYAMVNGGALPCKGPTNFYRMGPMWMINHATMIATEGYLGEPAKFAWIKSADGWMQYGNQIMRSTWGEDLKMNDIDIANRNLAKAKQEFMEFCKDKAAELKAERISKLTPDEQVVLSIPDLQRTMQEVYMAMHTESKVQVPYREVAAAMPADKQFRANELAIAVTRAEEFVQHVEIYRNQVNYQYWDMRCKAEQIQPALDARADLYAANKALDRGELDGAIAKFKSAWKNWAEVFNQFPSMMTDETAEEITKAIKRYRQISDEPLGDDFALNDFIKFREEFERANADPRLQSILTDWSKQEERGAYFKRIAELRAAEAAAGPTAAPTDGSAPGTEPTPAPPVPEKPAADKPAAEKTEEPKPSKTEPADTTKPAAEPKSAEPKPAEPKAELKAAQPDEGSAPAPVKADSKPTSNDPPPVEEPAAPDFK
ncbi:MAG: hypothetical protein IT423_15425 [Pirellulaceae bacterium]|nr:hypothetical protein [Pirellulaceae bacterium]